jgi:hypothetical protein
MLDCFRKQETTSESSDSEFIGNGTSSTDCMRMTIASARSFGAVLGHLKARQMNRGVSPSMLSIALLHALLIKMFLNSFFSETVEVPENGSNRGFVGSGKNCISDWKSEGHSE